MARFPTSYMDHESRPVDEPKLIVVANKPGLLFETKSDRLPHMKGEILSLISQKFEFHRSFIKQLE